MPLPPNYRIVEGGLGWILEWLDDGKWEWIMDSQLKIDCIICAHTQMLFVDRVN